MREQLELAGRRRYALTILRTTLALPMRMRFPLWLTHLTALLLGGAVAATIFLYPARSLLRDVRLPPPPHLSVTARSLLHRQMRDHGSNLTWLSRAAVTFDFAAVAPLASEIAATALLARPLDDDASLLNAELPERYFQLQDALRAAAARLGAAATSADAVGVGDAYAALAKTCVACHSVYLHEPAPLPRPAPDRRAGDSAPDAQGR